MPEFEGVSLFEAFVMAAVWAQTREREIHLSVELEFLWNDLEGGGALVVASTLRGLP